MVQPRWRASASRSGLGFTAKAYLAIISISVSQRELPKAASMGFLTTSWRAFGFPGPDGIRTRRLVTMSPCISGFAARIRSG